MRNTKAIDILLVEDDPGDVDLTKEGLKSAKMITDLHVVDDGIKALQYLKKEGPYADAVRPDIILLDLNLPRKSGLDVLREIKGNNDLKIIPVAVISTSDTDKDIEKSYALGANCYITKPVGFDAFVNMVHSLEDFWFAVVKMPPKE